MTSEPIEKVNDTTNDKYVVPIRKSQNAKENSLKFYFESFSWKFS